MRIDVWSDMVCPWCYIGKRRLEEALATFPRREEVEVVYHAFMLDPTMPKGRVQKQLDMLMSKYGASEEKARGMQTRVTAMAKEVGLEFQLENALAGNTFDAHRLVRLALEKGLQEAVLERLFRAYFCEGQSVFDTDALVKLGTEAGLDASEARAVLADNRFADEVQEDVEQAHALGANGVPLFVIDNRFGISGAQPAEVFASALERAFGAS